MEKKKFEDMRKALEDRGYEVMKSIGKGAFGEVLLSRKSITLFYSRTWRFDVGCESHFESASQEEAVSAEIHRPRDRNYEEARAQEHCEAGTGIGYN
jgi:hypothetical protein